MMASRISQQAAIEKCKLCDRNADARWFCTDCQEEMCKQCKTTHLRSKLGKTHNVISTASDVDGATGDQRPGKTVFCSSHLESPVQMYCNNCDVLVCFKCISGKHQKHSFDTIPDVIDKYKNELSLCIMDTKQHIDGLQSLLKFVQNNATAYSIQSDVNIEEINKKRQERKSQIDATADDLILQVQKSKSHNLQDLKQHETHITQEMSSKTEDLISCENEFKSNNGVSIIKFVADFKQRQKQYQSRPTPKFISPPRFVSSGSLKLQEVFGQLRTDEATCSDSIGVSPTIDTTVLANIDRGTPSLCVSAVNDQQAWCGGADTFERTGLYFELINIDGQVIKRLESFTVEDIPNVQELGLNFNFNYVAATSTGDFLFLNENCLKKYTQSGQVIDIKDMSDDTPNGFCLTAENDLLVCLYNHKSKQGKVIRLTQTGQVKQTIQLDQHNKSLFTEPKLIAVNVNKDIWVVDGSCHDKVVVVNKDGKFRFRYPTTAKARKTFTWCSGIACDKFGFVILSDMWNHCIHVTDKDGTLVQYLTEQQGIQYPRGLSVDNKGQLWVVNDDGFKITVLKYRS